VKLLGGPTDFASRIGGVRKERFGQEATIGSLDRCAPFRFHRYASY
jgi:hypothetical protein